MTQEPGPLAHKTIHEALAAIYREVGYVHKSGKVDSFGAKYTYAGEADLIAAVRPSMVDHEVYMHVAQVLNRKHETFTNAKGTLMHHVRLDVLVRFAHGPSGTFIDCMASGEGIDSGDKATPKALTGAFKYAIRQTFCIETGDDRPWTLFRGTYIVGGDDDCIGATDGLDKGDTEAKANAAFIVKAANAHDRLIEALEELEFSGENDRGTPGWCPVCRAYQKHIKGCQIDAALALARGEVEA